MTAPPDDEPHGGFAWRLTRVEGDIDSLRRRVDEQYRDLLEAGARRHDENRDRLEKIGVQLGEVTHDNRNLKSQVTRSAAIGGAIFVGVMVVLILAVLKLVGPALGAKAESPEQQIPGGQHEESAG